MIERTINYLASLIKSLIKRNVVDDDPHQDESGWGI